MAYSGLVPISPKTTPIAAMVSGHTPAFSISLPLELIAIFTSSLATVLISLGDGMLVPAVRWLSWSRSVLVQRVLAVTAILPSAVRLSSKDATLAMDALLVASPLIVAQHSIPGAGCDQAGNPTLDAPAGSGPAANRYARCDGVSF